MASKPITTMKDKQQVSRAIKKYNNEWDYKPHGREAFVENLPPFKDSERRDMMYKRKVKKYEKEGYIPINNEDAIAKIFPHSWEYKAERFAYGEVIFFVWKYSALLRVTEDEDKRNEFLENLSEVDAKAVISHIAEIGVARNNCFFNHLGNRELSKSNQLVVMDKSGKKWWIEDSINTGSVSSRRSHPLRRMISVWDLSMIQINKALSDIGGGATYKESEIEAIKSLHHKAEMERKKLEEMIKEKDLENEQLRNAIENSELKNNQDKPEKKQGKQSPRK